MITHTYLDNEIKELQEFRRIVKLRGDKVAEAYFTGRIISLEALYPLATNEKVH